MVSPSPPIHEVKCVSTDMIIRGIAINKQETKEIII